MSVPNPTSIEIDASMWTHVLDFYRAMFVAIGAPDGHGHSPDALNDSMVYGGMNDRESPYDIVIKHLHDKNIVDHINLVRDVLAMGRADFRAQNGRDVNVSIRLEGQLPVR